MAGTSVALALALIAIFLIGLWIGQRQGRAAVQLQVDEARNEIKELRPKAEELAATKQQLKNEEAKYAQMKSDLDAAFKAAAADALRANTQSFLALAKQELGGQTQEAKQTLDAKELAIKNLLDPLGVTLKNLDERTRAMETQRAGAYAKVETLVGNLQQSIPASLEALKNETSQLITALRAPKTRGNWGELQLKRCVEYAGMVEYCSFTAQASARDEDDRLLRPDMTIQLPNGRVIVVDAKTPLDAFLETAGGNDPATQKLRFEAHAQRVKAHLKDLSGKTYWKQFEKAPDFVVCFLPSEALFSAALEADPSLIEFGAQNRVIMATPTTLIALLRAVEFGWQQMDITKSAKAIHELGRRIYDKLVAAQSHVTRLGNALGTSVDAYNKFLGSVEGKQGGSVFFLGRQLGELVHADQELPEASKVHSETREFESSEWTQPLLTNSTVDDSGLALAAEADESDDAGK
jgi:DNA recombination protein RmuC